MSIDPEGVHALGVAYQAFDLPGREGLGDGDEGVAEFIWKYQ